MGLGFRVEGISISILKILLLSLLLILLLSRFVLAILSNSFYVL